MYEVFLLEKKIKQKKHKNQLRKFKDGGVEEANRSLGFEDWNFPASQHNTPQQEETSSDNLSTKPVLASTENDSSSGIEGELSAEKKPGAAAASDESAASTPVAVSGESPEFSTPTAQ
ncbi:hypothetical protein O0L34_g17507 [Tuta absoluta]|nr:hypothetical protein O0L34_g17507 [Tuta absoluta]